jgi:uncharacterized membrane protein
MRGAFWAPLFLFRRKNTKATLFGLGLSVFGTFVYFLATITWHVRRARASGVQGQIGIDVVSLSRSAFHNPYYWVLAVGLLATGFAMFAMWPRIGPTP